MCHVPSVPDFASFGLMAVSQHADESYQFSRSVRGWSTREVKHVPQDHIAKI